MKIEKIRYAIPSFNMDVQKEQKDKIQKNNNVDINIKKDPAKDEFIKEDRKTNLITEFINNQKKDKKDKEDKKV